MTQLDVLNCGSSSVALGTYNWQQGSDSGMHGMNHFTVATLCCSWLELLIKTQGSSCVIYLCYVRLEKSNCNVIGQLGYHYCLMTTLMHVYYHLVMGFKYNPQATWLHYRPNWSCTSYPPPPSKTKFSVYNYSGWYRPIYIQQANACKAHSHLLTLLLACPTSLLHCIIIYPSCWKVCTTRTTSMTGWNKHRAPQCMHYSEVPL